MTDEVWFSLDLQGLFFGAGERRGIYRKLRLFAAACFRAIPAEVRDPRSEHAVTLAEHFADGLASEAELAAAEERAVGVTRDWPVTASAAAWAAHAALAACAESRNLWHTALHAAYDAADAISWAHLGVAYRNGTGHWGTGNNWPESLFRDLVRHPSRSITFEPAWQTDNVIDLARAIYDERAFERLPILADALMEAGCNDDEIVQHCQGPGPHARGCWVVDGILGKDR